MNLIVCRKARDLEEEWNRIEKKFNDEKTLLQTLHNDASTVSIERSPRTVDCANCDSALIVKCFVTTYTYIELYSRRFNVE